MLGGREMFTKVLSKLIYLFSSVAVQKSASFPPRVRNADF
jgi:hypothetical protein